MTRKWPETLDFLLYEIVNGSLTFSITALEKRVLCDSNFVLYVMSSSCTRLSNISRNTRNGLFLT